MPVRRKPQDGTGRADLRTLRALGAAIAAFVGGFGLHERLGPGGGPQNVIRTDRDAELAARAVRRQMAQGPGARRHEGRDAVRRPLVQNDGQTAVHFLFLRPDDRRTEQQPRSGQEIPAARIGRSRRFRPFSGRRSRNGCGGLRAKPVADRPVPANVEAVHAGHAARIVDPAVPVVDTGGLAPPGAQAAVPAFLRVDHGPEQRIFREEPQHRPHRADRIAIGPAVAPRQHDEHGARRSGDQQRRQARHPDLRFIERIASHTLGDRGQRIVAPEINRTEEVGGDTSVGAVRRKQSDQRTHAGDQRRDEQRQRPAAQPPPGRRVGETVLPPFPAAAEPGDEILKHPERADDRAIDPAEKERQHRKRRHDTDIQRQHRRQELHPGHPSQPGMERPREIEEEQRDAREEENGERPSDFLQHKLPNLCCKNTE